MTNSTKPLTAKEALRGLARIAPKLQEPLQRLADNTPPKLLLRDVALLGAIIVDSTKADETFSFLRLVSAFIHTPEERERVDAGIARYQAIKRVQSAPHRCSYDSGGRCIDRCEEASLFDRLSKKID